MNNAVDFAITAGHLAQDRSDRLGVGYIAGMVRGLDPGGVQIRQGLSHLHGPVVGSERLSRRRQGARLDGIDAGIKRCPPQKDQAGPEGRQAAGQVGGDSRRAPGHDDHVSRAQVKTCRTIEDRRGDPPLRSEDPAIPMHHLHHGVAPVQSPAEGGAQVGIRVDCQGAKLDRWVFLGGAQKQSEHPLRRQPTESFGIFPGMDQHDEFLRR